MPNMRFYDDQFWDLSRRGTRGRATSVDRGRRCPQRVGPCQRRSTSGRSARRVGIPTGRCDQTTRATVRIAADNVRSDYDIKEYSLSSETSPPIGPLPIAGLQIPAERVCSVTLRYNQPGSYVDVRLRDPDVLLRISLRSAYADGITDWVLRWQGIPEFLEEGQDDMASER
jgi:hypothetical protein